MNISKLIILITDRPIQVVLKMLAWRHKSTLLQHDYDGWMGSLCIGLNSKMHEEGYKGMRVVVAEIKNENNLLLCVICR